MARAGFGSRRACETLISSGRVRVDGEGVATVEPGDGEPDATLGIAALSSMYAGGVRAGTLRGAGRLSASPAITETLDRAFAAFPAPSLDIWY